MKTLLILSEQLTQSMRWCLFQRIVASGNETELTRLMRAWTREIVITSDTERPMLTIIRVLESESIYESIIRIRLEGLRLRKNHFFSDDSITGSIKLNLRHVKVIFAPISNCCVTTACNMFIHSCQLAVRISIDKSIDLKC